MKQFLSGGTVHILPDDMRSSLAKDSAASVAWEDITPLARNEFICWVISPAKPETRTKRITIAIEKLSRGERRPCCWIGCIHRPDKPLSPSVKGILSKRSQKR